MLKRTRSVSEKIPTTSDTPTSIASRLQYLRNSITFETPEQPYSFVSEPQSVKQALQKVNNATADIIQSQVDVRPYTILQNLLVSQNVNFFRVMGNTIETLMEQKLQKYKKLKKDVERQLEAQEQTQKAFSKEQLNDYPGRYSYFANKQIESRYDYIIKLIDAYETAFFATEKELTKRGNVYTLVKEFRNDVKDELAAQFGTNTALKGESIWIQFIALRLNDVFQSKQGFYILNGRPEIQDSIATIVLSLAYGPNVFKSKYYNMVLMGPTGIGKTTIAKAIGYIMSELFIVLDDQVHIFTSQSFKAEFEGQTATKTRSLFLESLESVMFLDEAYALTNCTVRGPSASIGNDYGTEAVNELVALMTEYQGLYIFIVAGYEQQMKNCFLVSNEGFQRRFDGSLRFILKAYSTEELLQLYLQKLRESNLRLTDIEIYDLIQFVRTIYDDSKTLFFPNSAADVQTLVDELSTIVGLQYTAFLLERPDVDTQLLRLYTLALGLSKFVRSRDASLQSKEVLYNKNNNKFEIK